MYNLDIVCYLIVEAAHWDLGSEMFCFLYFDTR